MSFLVALLISLEIALGTSDAIRDNHNFKQVCHVRIGFFGQPLKNSDGTTKQKCRMVRKTESELSNDSENPDDINQKN
jgi:hypothetical protein